MGRLKLKNRPLAKRPGGGTFQHVYMMNGCELCAVEAAAQPEEVRETVLRMLNLQGPLTAVVQLIRLGSQSYMGNAGDWQVMIHPTLMHKNEGYVEAAGICDVCSGVFGTEACFLLDDFEACTLCYPTGCCSCVTRRPLSRLVSKPSLYKGRLVTKAVWLQKAVW